MTPNEMLIVKNEHPKFCISVHKPLEHHGTTTMPSWAQRDVHRAGVALFGSGNGDSFGREGRHVVPAIKKHGYTKQCVDQANRTQADLPTNDE